MPGARADRGRRAIDARAAVDRPGRDGYEVLIAEDGANAVALLRSSGSTS